MLPAVLVLLWSIPDSLSRDHTPTPSSWPCYMNNLQEYSYRLGIYSMDNPSTVSWCAGRLFYCTPDDKNAQNKLKTT